jgi:hypothetical protein
MRHRTSRIDLIPLGVSCDWRVWDATRAKPPLTWGELCSVSLNERLRPHQHRCLEETSARLLACLAKSRARWPTVCHERTAIGGVIMRRRKLKPRCEGT